MEWAIALSLLGAVVAFDPIRSHFRADKADGESLPERDALTIASLSALGDDDLIYTISDYAWAYFYLDIQEGYGWPDHLRSLPAQFKGICAAIELQGEVDNGGFSQFFSNSSGALAYEARDGCDLIGATGHSRIVSMAIEQEKTIGTWGSQFPDSATYLDTSDRDMYADFEDLETMFYQAPRSLYQYCLAFIKSDLGMFVAPAIP